MDWRKKILSIRIRAASYEDEEAIRALYVEGIGTKLSEGLFEVIYKEIIEDIQQIIMVAELSGKLVGFVHARRLKELSRGYITEIVEMTVTERCRRRGIGKELLSGAEFWSSQMSVRTVKCRAFRNNESADAFLLYCGYELSDSGMYEKRIN